MFAHSFEITECSLDWKTVIGNITAQEDCDRMAAPLNDTEAQGYHLFKTVISIPVHRDTGIFMGVFIFAKDRRKTVRKPLHLHSFEYGEGHDRALEVGATIVHRYTVSGETATHILRRG